MTQTTIIYVLRGPGITTGPTSWAGPQSCAAVKRERNFVAPAALLLGALSPSWTSEPAGILPIWRSVVLRAAAFSSADLRGGVLAAACDAPAAEDEAADGPAAWLKSGWKKASRVPRVGSSER